MIGLCIDDQLSSITNDCILSLHFIQPMKNLTFSEEEIFERIVEEGIFEGAVTEEEYHTLVEEVINDMLGMGELNDDQNLQGHIEHLKARFGEYEKRLADA